MTTTSRTAGIRCMRAIAPGALVVSVAIMLTGVTPAGAAGGTGVVAVVRGSNGAAFSLQGNDTVAPAFAGAYAALGGAVIGAPAVVAVPQSFAVPDATATPYFIATGIDRSLWVRSNVAPWQRLSPQYAACTSSPEATAVNAHAAGAVLLTVACRGTDGALWVATQSPAPSDPSVLPSVTGWHSLGGITVDGPAIAAVVGPASTVPSELTYFVNGTDGKVYTRTELSAGWSATPWRCIGHPAAAAVVSPGGNVAAFACQGTDRAVWQSTNRDGAGWSAAASLGGVVVGGPGIALGPLTWTVVAEGTDRALWQTSSATSAAAFSAWSSAGGVLTSGATSAALLFQTESP